MHLNNNERVLHFGHYLFDQNDLNSLPSNILLGLVLLKPLCNADQQTTLVGK